MPYAAGQPFGAAVGWTNEADAGYAWVAILRRCPASLDVLAGSLLWGWRRNTVALVRPSDCSRVGG